MLENVANTVTDEPVEVSIDILPQGKMHETLQKWKIRKKKRVYQIRQITLGNLIRISKLILSIDVLNMDNSETIMNGTFESMSLHGNTMAEIVAIALHNKKDAPPKHLVEFVKANFTPSELHGVLSIVIKQMNVQGFIISIVSVKGMNILPKASPADQGR